MAVATKAAAFGVILRLFDVALIEATTTWAPAFATLAVITIVVGNVGAIGQSSLKRMLAYSSVAQAGYMLAGVVVTTQLGISATIFYLAIYVVMNLAAFAVITARERETGLGDDISSLYGLGRDRPWLAWPMTIAMLALAGFPATAGFFGKIYLINAAVDNGYAWLGIVIVLGSAVSLAYYLRVVAAVWMRSPSEAPAPLASPVTARPAIAGGSPEADDEDRAAGREPGSGGVPLTKPDTGAVVESDFDDEPAEVHLTDARFQPEVVFVAVVCALVTVVFGIFPEPLLERRQGRRRSDPVAGLSSPGGELSSPPTSEGCAIASHRRSGDHRIHRRHRPRGAGVRPRRAGGGRSLDRGRRRPRVQARAVHRRRRHLHAGGCRPGRRRAVPARFAGRPAARRPARS